MLSFFELVARSRRCHLIDGHHFRKVSMLITMARITLDFIVTTRVVPYKGALLVNRQNRLQVYVLRFITLLYRLSKIAFHTTLSKDLDNSRHNFRMHGIRQRVAITAFSTSIRFRFRNCNDSCEGEVIRIPAYGFLICLISLTCSRKRQ